MDEMRLSELLDIMSPQELEALAGRIPEGAQSYFGSPTPPTWRGGIGGARPIPNYGSPHPPAWDRDREAPEIYDRYGRRRR